MPLVVETSEDCINAARNSRNNSAVPILKVLDFVTQWLILAIDR